MGMAMRDVRNALGPWGGLAAGAGYFVFVWVCTGVYLSIFVHLGVAHRAFRFKPRFVSVLTLVNSLVAIHVNPKVWVNKHRNHHAFSDQHGDPHKLESDGFWRTPYLSFWSYPCRVDLPRDPMVVIATFSGCWQDNHHRHPNLARMTHHYSEYDFGLQMARLLRKLGWMEPSATGIRLPPDVPLTELGL